MRRAVATIALALVLAAGPAGQAPRIVAVGDIHGDVESFTSLLRQAGLVDPNGAWAGGSTTLIQTGDYTDRGDDVRAVLDLLMGLEGKARAKGGRVVVLLGNHEAMNLLGVTRDATPAIYATFADANSRKRIDAAWADYQRLRDGLASKGQAVPGALGATRDAFDRAHPPGYIEYREALGPRGVYGKWLRDKPMVTALGSTIFIHAGIPPASVPDMLDDLNKQLRDDKTRYEAAIAQMGEHLAAIARDVIAEPHDRCFRQRLENLVQHLAPPVEANGSQIAALAIEIGAGHPSRGLAGTALDGGHLCGCHTGYAGERTKVAVEEHFNYLTARFNTNVNDANFGTSFPASTASLDATPRIVQFGIKATW